MFGAVSDPYCVNDHKRFWIAGKRADPVTGGRVTWKIMTSNGHEERPLIYTNWMTGEPNDTGESCLTFWDNYEWIDAECFSEVCYMCEYETWMSFGFTGDGYNCTGRPTYLATQ